MKIQYNIYLLILNLNIILCEDPPAETPAADATPAADTDKKEGTIVQEGEKLTSKGIKLVVARSHFRRFSKKDDKTARQN